MFTVHEGYIILTPLITLLDREVFLLVILNSSVHEYWGIVLEKILLVTK